MKAAASTELTAEMRSRQQNAARVDLRERMEEDSRITKMNQLKVTNQWRKIMRLAKTESLKADIEILSQNHERNVDRKDAILHMLVGDMHEAEAQFQTATRGHLKNIDILIQINDSGLTELERMYQKHLNLIQTNFHDEMKLLHDQFNQERQTLIQAVDNIDHEEEFKKHDAKQAFEQQREELRNRNVEDINMLRITLDSQIEDLEQQFETAHLNYMQQTGQRTHEYKDLAQNDKALTDDIDKRKKKIDSLQMLLLQWRGKSRQLVEDSDERRRMLVTEKRNMQLHYQQLKNRIKSYRALQNQRLLQLSSCAGACEQKLRGNLEIARSVLSLGQLTRDIDNKTMGFSSSNAGSATASTSYFQKRQQQQQQFIDDNQHQSYSSSTSSNNKLNNFYTVYNKVLLETIDIEKEKERLQSENQQLQELINQYERAKTLSPDALDTVNTLLIVNGRTDINQELALRNLGANTTMGIMSSSSSSSSSARNSPSNSKLQMMMGGGVGKRSSSTGNINQQHIVIQEGSQLPQISGKLKGLNLAY